MFCPTLLHWDFLERGKVSTLWIAVISQCDAHCECLATIKNSKIVSVSGASSSRLLCGTNPIQDSS
ncbi:hypothetical protein CSKR_110456 [Clonorchis sinensis]|uniref:Uncharacterized protein n=1 Tax=Clonorchis sinensis TaxID=79923 RepID=A0A8T1MGM2_CLOSI|nr:hypothetical protein CSKR_110456 [Clonorchis sinensis]